MGLASLVHRDLDSEFAGSIGSSVRVRVPGAVPAQTRPVNSLATLTKDAITEQSIAVSLDVEAYSLVPLSDGDLDLDIKDYGVQVLLPQTRALTRYVERSLVAAMQATPASTITYAAATPAKAFTAIRKALRDAGVPADVKIHAAVGSSVYGALLDAPTGTFDADGKSVRGIEVHESTRLAATEIVAFVRDAFAVVVRAPRVPDGAPYGASVKDKEAGFALRLIRAYDPNIAADTSLLTAFVGVQAMPLAVDNEDGTVDLVEHGGVIRVVTA
ncbi:P22 phage major capsid protein family protein [Cryobacterium soli]|uniref:P22 phage major capsid protein family protein n=1 Tax=Cryobacterium soli TaxID=2220095 RepID=UPI0013C4B9E5|nr:P22 phage major capsid protein family protein [Cryobacterium soli]